MPTPQEPDHPPGHPKRFDYDPASPEAIEWKRKNFHPLGERDFPVDHPKAIDTPGNTNHIPALPGVDPNHPEREPFTGRQRHKKTVAPATPDTPPGSATQSAGLSMSHPAVSAAATALGAVDSTD